MAPTFFLSKLGLKLADFVSDDTPEKILEVDPPKPIKQPKISPFHFEVGTTVLPVSFTKVYGIFNDDLNAEATKWYDVTIDDDDDPTIDISLNADFIKAIKFWVKLGDSKLIRIPDEAIKFDKDKDVRFVLPAPQHKFTPLNLREYVRPANFKTSFAFGKLIFRAGKGFFIFNGSDWVITTIFDGGDYTDGAMYEFF